MIAKIGCTARVVRGHWRDDWLRPCDKARCGHDARWNTGAVILGRHGSAQVHVENTGGLLSLGATLPPPVRMAVFTVGTGLMLLVLIVTAMRCRWSRWRLLGLSLFVAGGASNWMDRVARGRVVDFINIGIGSVRTGIFNVADVAIMLGVGVVILADSVGTEMPKTPTEAS